MVQLGEEAVALRWSLCQYSRVIKIEKCSALSSAIPSYALAHLQHLQELKIWSCDSMKDVFEIKRVVGNDVTSRPGDGSSRSVAVPSFTISILPDLRNLRKLDIWRCHLLRDVFPFSTLQSLTKLESLKISSCDGIRVIVREEEEEDGNHTTSSSSDPYKLPVFFPCLKSVELENLPNLESFFLGTNAFQYCPVLDRFQIWKCPKMRMLTQGQWDSPVLKYLHSDSYLQEEPVTLWSFWIRECSGLSSAISPYALGRMQNLKELRIDGCDSMKEVFEMERVVENDHVTSSVVSSLKNSNKVKQLRFLLFCVGTNSNNNGSSSDVVSSLTTNTNTTTIRILPDLRNLGSLVISGCPQLRDVFPFSTLQSLTKLQHLEIRGCDGIRVIVQEEEEDGNHTTSSSDDQVVVFPCLKRVELYHLPNLEGFFLGRNNFRWPVLDTVWIRDCLKMRMFTKGHSDSPMLKSIRSDMGEHSAEYGLNHHPTAAALQEEEEVPNPSLDGSTSSSVLPISERRMPWFYNNLITVDVRDRLNQRFVIRHNELQHLQKIEKIKISQCSGERGIFETFDMDDSLNQTHSVLEVREMEFEGLFDSRCLWKSKQWTVLKFPNLTTLSLDRCFNLRYVFTISMVDSLLRLQELAIIHCPGMQIILADVEKDEVEQIDNGKEHEDEDQRRVDEDYGKEKGHNDERRMKVVEFPCLRRICLHDLMSLKGFCLGMETIHLPSLDTLSISMCPSITTFTNGQSTTPKLKLIQTSYGLGDATEGVNSFIRTRIEKICTGFRLLGASYIATIDLRKFNVAVGEAIGQCSGF
uniref:uncharacterized protein LOC122590801 n=1 Tax=Erigeron canadensis TaxID=72917 RepID=UPI001CB917F8|nr:uncharacterized protein LOC122590801 [Erigeron canadensis]